MKYTAKITQAQFVGKIKIEPKSGDLTDAQVKAITADPWGNELIRKGMLTIEGTKPADTEAEKKK
jgi:hypothetical protein